MYLTDISDYIGKEVSLKGGEKGVVYDIERDKKLLKIRTPDGKSTSRYPNNVSLISNQQTMSDTSSPDPIVQELPKYSINQKFDFMQKMVRMVVRNISPSVIISGEGGLGKTKLVNDVLEDNNLELEEHYCVIKGFSTAKGLYRKLYEYSEKLLIFDDCDEALTNDISKNLLKSALDSYDKRIISWVTNSIDDSLPDSFEFSGNIIFISNLPSSKLDQALLSRSLTIDLTMSIDDKIARMKYLADKMMPHLDLDFKLECISLIEENKSRVKDLNLRTFIKACKVREAEPEDWIGMVEFMMLSGA